MNSKASSKKNIFTDFYMLLTSLMFLLSSCNVYRSEGRKNLDSAGPPPGSIRTTSIGFLKIASTQNFQIGTKTFDVCKLSSIESKICSENFVCIQISKEEINKQPDADRIVEMEQALLIDKNDSQSVIELALICKSLDL